MLAFKAIQLGSSIASVGILSKVRVGQPQIRFICPLISDIDIDGKNLFALRVYGDILDLTANIGALKASVSPPSKSLNPSLE